MYFRLDQLGKNALRDFFALVGGVAGRQKILTEHGFGPP
jgi:hypothetical protein